MEQNILREYVLKKQTLEGRKQERKATRNRRKSDDEIRPLVCLRVVVELSEVQSFQRQLVPELTDGLAAFQSAKQGVSAAAKRPGDQ